MLREELAQVAVILELRRVRRLLRPGLCGVPGIDPVLQRLPRTSPDEVAHLLIEVEPPTDRCEAERPRPLTATEAGPDDPCSGQGGWGLYSPWSWGCCQRRWAFPCRQQGGDPRGEGHFRACRR